MKNPVLLAFVFVIGITSVSFAQFSSVSSSKAIHSATNDVYLQDTTKNPVKDTVPVKKDSLPVKKDSSSLNF